MSKLFKECFPEFNFSLYIANWLINDDNLRALDEVESDDKCSNNHGEKLKKEEKLIPKFLIDSSMDSEINTKEKKEEEESKNNLNINSSPYFPPSFCGEQRANKIRKTKERKNSNKKKEFEEKEGDWICCKCRNINFSFRKQCNKCQLSEEASEKMYDNILDKIKRTYKVIPKIPQRL